MENYIAGFLRCLPPGTFRFTCICPCESPFTETLRALGAEAVYVTPLADDPDWRSIQMAVEVIKLHQVDVIHAHMPKSHVLAGIAGALMHKPVVATVHGMHLTAHELGVALASKSHLIVNCQETFIQALALGIPAGRLKLFHNGVDTNIFVPNAAGKKLRRYINVSSAATLVGFVGRLEPDKGPDHFVNVAGLIHEVLPGVHFVIVGEGSMRKKLVQMQKRLGLQKHLHFINWASKPETVYSAFDLLIHSSRNDGTSLVLLEAMACGRPVVGMAVGGIREIVENEQTGMLVEAGDCVAMANQVIELLEQPRLMKTMGIAGRRRVEKYFNVKVNSQKVAALLRRIAFDWRQQHEGDLLKATKRLNGNGSAMLALKK